MICTLSPSSMIRSTNSAAMSFFRQRMRVENQTDAAVQNGSAHAKAAQVRRAAKNRLRRDLSRQKRQSNVKISNLVKDEKTVRPRGRRRRGRFSRTICATCSRRRFIAHTRTSSSSRTSLDTRASKRHAFTLSPVRQSIGGSLSGYSSYHKKTEFVFRICKGSERILSLPLLINKYSTIAP